MHKKNEVIVKEKEDCVEIEMKVYKDTLVNGYYVIEQHEAGVGSKFMCSIPCVLKVIVDDKGNGVVFG